MSSRRDWPVVDVAAALLILLLVLVPAPEVKPPGPEPPPLPPRRIVVTVESDGAVRVGAQPVEIGQLHARLEQIAGPGDTVVVRVPRSLDRRRFDQLRAAVQGVGILRLNLLPP